MAKPKTICVYCGSAVGARAEYRTIAAELGTAMAEADFRLVYGGAHVGLMGAIADAALAAGGEVVGVIPQQLVDREVAHRGLMIMGVLSFAGIESVHEINALKTAIIGVSSIVATVTFLFYGAVLWHYGLLMMLAAGIGGYASARIARRHKPRGIRMAIIAMGCIVTAYYFWKVY